MEKLIEKLTAAVEATNERIAVFEKELGCLIKAVTEAVHEMRIHSEARKKLSEAGKRSAEARRQKFGSAQPPPHVTIAKVLEQVREGVRENNTNPEQVPEGVRGNGGKPEQVREGVRGKTHGSLVWESYSKAYFSRYGVVPARGAKVNAQCKNLVGYVGAEDAIALAQYYLTRDDSFYVMKCHAMGFCLADAQKLLTEMKSGMVITMGDARRIELDSQNHRAVNQYLKRKHEQVPEGVRGNGVKNDDTGSTK